MDVLITSKPELLPPEVAQLQDVSRPLPAGVQFFERRYTYGDLIKQFLLGIALIPVGVILILFGIFVMFAQDRSTVYSSSSQMELTIVVVGLVLCLGGYLLLQMLLPKFRFMRQQDRGVATRQGIFLIGDLLVSNDVGDTTVIPKEFFKGLKDHKVQYQLKDQLKSFDLPSEWIGQGRHSLEAAIARWAA